MSSGSEEVRTWMQSVCGECCPGGLWYDVSISIFFYIALFPWLFQIIVLCLHIVFLFVDLFLSFSIILFLKTTKWRSKKYCTYSYIYFMYMSHGDSYHIFLLKKHGEGVSCCILWRTDIHWKEQSRKFIKWSAKGGWKPRMFMNIIL